MMRFINETFTGSNATAINGFNSWSAVGGTGFQIQSNQAAKTDDGACFCYQTISIRGIQGRYRTTFSRYTGTGTRFFNEIVIGSNDVSTVTNFINNGISFRYFRSGGGTNNSTIQVYDKTTQVATKATSFQFDGSAVTMDVTVNADGSGTLTVNQGVSSDNVSWSARTWSTVNNIHGVALEWSGTDGAAELTRSQIDDVIFENPVGVAWITA